MGFLLKSPPISPQPKPKKKRWHNWKQQLLGGWRVRPYSPCYRPWKKFPEIQQSTLPCQSCRYHQTLWAVGLSKWATQSAGSRFITRVCHLWTVFIDIIDWDSGDYNAKGILIPVSVLIHMLHMHQHHLVPLPCCNAVNSTTTSCDYGHCVSFWKSTRNQKYVHFQGFFSLYVTVKILQKDACEIRVNERTEKN